MLGVILVVTAFVVATLFPNLFALVVLGCVFVLAVPHVKARWRETHRR